MTALSYDQRPVAQSHERLPLILVGPIGEFNARLRKIWRRLRIWRNGLLPASRTTGNPSFIFGHMIRLLMLFRLSQKRSRNETNWPVLACALGLACGIGQRMPISLEPVSRSGTQIASRSSSRGRQRQRNLTKNSSAGSQLCQSDTPSNLLSAVLTRLYRLLFAVDVGLVDEGTPLPIRPFLKLKAHQVQTTQKEAGTRSRMAIRPRNAAGQFIVSGPPSSGRSSKPRVDRLGVPLAASTGSRLQVPRHSSSTH
jgi:hypothetical protein